jgi:predicted lipoprotein
MSPTSETTLMYMRSLPVGTMRAKQLTGGTPSFHSVLQQLSTNAQGPACLAAGTLHTTLQSVQRTLCTLCMSVKQPQCGSARTCTQHSVNTWMTSTTEVRGPVPRNTKLGQACVLATGVRFL